MWLSSGSGGGAVGTVWRRGEEAGNSYEFGNLDLDPMSENLNAPNKRKTQVLLRHPRKEKSYSDSTVLYRAGKMKNLTQSCVVYLTFIFPFIFHNFILLQVPCIAETYLSIPLRVPMIRGISASACTKKSYITHALGVHLRVSRAAWSLSLASGDGGGAGGTCAPEPLPRERRRWRRGLVRFGRFERRPFQQPCRSSSFFLFLRRLISSLFFTRK